MALINNEQYSLFYQRLTLIYQRPEVKASLEVILSVFTVTFLIFAAIRPTLTNITSLQRKIDDLDSANKKADNKIAQIFNAQTQLTNFQSKLYLLNEAVPDDFSYKDMSGRLEVLAKGRGLEVQTVTLPGFRLFGEGAGTGEWSAKLVQKDQTNIASATVQFTVSGTPANVQTFLTDIESMDRVTLLRQITLSTETGPNRSLRLKAVGELIFYFYLET